MQSECTVEPRLVENAKVLSLARVSSVNGQEECPAALSENYLI